MEYTILTVLTALLLAPLAMTIPLYGISAKEIMYASGVAGGLAIQFSFRNDTLTAELLANDRYVVKGLEAERKCKRMQEMPEQDQSFNAAEKVSRESDV